jgi:hypothetical protein
VIMCSSLRRLPSAALFVVAFSGATLAACSGPSLDGDVSEAAQRESAGEHANAERAETVAYIDVERVTLAAADIDGLGASNELSPAAEVDAAARDAAARDGAVRDNSVQNPNAGASVQALAHFAEVTTNATRLLEMAGLIRRVPEVGQCEQSVTGERAADVPATTETGGFELLEAGAVRLIPEGQAAVTLAPRAFPGVSSLASGVMYTSRERSALLPSGLAYQIEVSGSAQILPMTIHGQAPRQLENVTINGSPLPDIEVLSTLRPHDVTWDVGSAGDVVYVDIQSQDQSQVARCSYADEAGAGSVPVSVMARINGEARLAVHRLRRVNTVPSASNVRAESHAVLPARAEVRFDFEFGRQVRFTNESVENGVRSARDPDQAEIAD